jgi:hypothetical protein
MRKPVWALLALAAVPLPALAEQWELTNAQVSVRLNAGQLRDMGIRVTPAVATDGDGYASYRFAVEGGLVATATSGVFRTVSGGELRLSGGPVLRRGRVTVSFDGASLRPGDEPSTYVVYAPDGTALFAMDHQHLTIDRAARTARFFNLDLRLSRPLAERLGHAPLAHVAIGQMEISAAAKTPFSAEFQPDGACVTPNWGLPDNDVGLLSMSPIQQVASGNGLVVIAPSATLRNVGVTEVPWISKFSAPQPPYNNDQHPYLVWNMYRVSSGRLEQIGASGLKHAFLTVNSGCGCAGGSILWVSCEDTYGVGTNNSTSSLGPRTEVSAHTGVWQRCGSVFDPECDNVQNSQPPFSGPEDARRLSVLQADLTNVSKGTRFYVDAWYVVRDDTDIFNTMGYRQVAVSLSGSTWAINPVTPLAAGSVVDAWVNPAAPGPSADNKRLDTGEGQLTVGVRAFAEGSLWRYEYAVMNHDFDRRIKSLTLALPSGETAVKMAFHDADRNPATDWVAVSSPGSVSWTAPSGQAKAPLDWGLLNSFTFLTSSPPTTAGGATLRLGIEEAPGGELTIAILGPSVP